jgi:hypothetical protein
MKFHCINYIVGKCPEQSTGETCDSYNGNKVMKWLDNTEIEDYNLLFINKTLTCSYGFVYRWVGVIE